MSYADNISREARQKLYFEFSKALLDKRILFKGSVIEKYIVFARILEKCKDEGEFIVMASYLMTNKLPYYKTVWKWELLGYKNKM